MPNTKEKLIELQSIITCPNAICNFCEHFKNKSSCEKHKKEVIADNMIAHGVTVQEWIPASEPPKDHKEYIVMIKGANCPTTLWYRPKQKTWSEACGDKNYDVTHWCCLPQPPKGE